MLVRVALTTGTALVLAGCGSAEPSRDADASSTSETTSSSASTTPSSSAAGVGYDLDLAVDICSTGMSESDTLVYDAAEAARAGTRTVQEIADAFRAAQDSVEDQANLADAGALPNLAGALQDYADTLGRARVSGTASVDNITNARQAVDLACFTPAVATS